MIVDYRLFAKRADGCVDESTCEKLSCEGACPDGQSCTITTLTCDSCPKIVCVSDSSVAPLSQKKTPVGAIVGGVVGGVVLLAILAAIGYLIYRFRSKHPVEFDTDEKDDDSDYCISNIDSHNGDGLASSNEITVFSEKPSAKSARSKRISSYESFTKPTYPGAKRSQAAQARRDRQRQIVKQANAQLNPAGYTDVDPALYRNSIATSVSTGNASNILPIAYIPGVTVRPTKNNTRSIYSSESESIFSDLNTIENASIIGDVIRANNNSNPAMVSQSHDATMTAIKAQPRLVNVDKIDEEDESEDEDYTPLDHVHVEAIGGHDDDSDSDVDSDIGEITRAASFRRPKPTLVNTNVPPPLNLTDELNMRSPSFGSPSLRTPLDSAPVMIPPSISTSHSNLSDVAISERELVLESAAGQRRTKTSEVPLDFINFDTPRHQESEDDDLDLSLETPPPRDVHSFPTRSPFDDPE